MAVLLTFEHWPWNNGLNQAGHSRPAQEITMSTIAVSDETFEQDVLQSSKLVLVDFWAEWCAPCKQIGPALEELAGERADVLTIAKVNIDDNPDVPSKFGVRSIPTLVLFRDGQIVSTRVGAMAKSRIAEWLDEVG
jgi:thioredoxin 1